MTHIRTVDVLQLFKFALLFVLIQTKEALGQENYKLIGQNLMKCPRFHTQNITGGTMLNGSYHHEEKVYPPGHFGYFKQILDENATERHTELHVRGCIFTHSERKCIRVCCEPDDNGTIPEICPHVFVNNTYHDYTGEEIFLEMHHHLIYHDLECEINEETGKPYDKVEFEFEIFENGLIYVPDDDSFLDYDQHCVAVDRQNHHLLVLRCYEPEENVKRYQMLGIGMLLSVPFLLATFIVYAMLPELRNVNGMSLLSYVGALTVGYTFLATVQIIGSRDECHDGSETCYDPTFCTTAGYIIYFSFMLSFFWMNTMSFDIFCTFSKRGPYSSSNKKNFMCYCLYAWGMASFLTILVLSLDLSNIHDGYKPGMYYKQTCFLRHNRIVEFLYLYMILLILVCINLSFFVLTANRIKKVESEMTAIVETGNSSRHSMHNNDKDQFMLYFRLFIITGGSIPITWSMELLSWVVSPDSPWFYVTDLVNCLQGILIFLIAVCNKNVRKLIVKRYRKFTETGK